MGDPLLLQSMVVGSACGVNMFRDDRAVWLIRIPSVPLSDYEGSEKALGPQKKAANGLEVWMT
jgi:hypothetical protein